MTRRRRRLALIAFVAVAALSAVGAIACAGAGEAAAGPPSDGVTYLVKVTGAG